MELKSKSRHTMTWNESTRFHLIWSGCAIQMQAISLMRWARWTDSLCHTLFQVIAGFQLIKVLWAFSLFSLDSSIPLNNDCSHIFCLSVNNCRIWNRFFVCNRQWLQQKTDFNKWPLTKMITAHHAGISINKRVNSFWYIS